MPPPSLYSFKLFHAEHVKASPGSKHLPAPRNGHKIVCTSRFLYLCGGYDSITNTICRDIWRFNLATKKWKRCAGSHVVPAKAAAAALLKRGNQLMLYGGTGVPFGFTSSNKLHCFNLSDKPVTVSKIKIAGERPQQRYGQAAIMHKNSLYAIGGTDGLTFSCDIHRVNLSKRNKVWKAVHLTSLQKHVYEDDFEPYEPRGRYKHEAICDGKNIFLIGGGTACVAFDLIELPVFNIATRSWRRVISIGDPNVDPHYPQPRRYHSVVHVRSGDSQCVYVICGLGSDGALNDLWKLDLYKLQWTLVSNNILPCGLYWHSAALSNYGRLYIFGGIRNHLDLVRNNDIYRVWVRLPKLSELAWEAVLYYIGHNNISTSVLNDLKLPRYIVNRVNK